MARPDPALSAARWVSAAPAASRPPPPGAGALLGLGQGRFQPRKDRKAGLARRKFVSGGAASFRAGCEMRFPCVVLPDGSRYCPCAAACCGVALQRRYLKSGYGHFWQLLEAQPLRRFPGSCFLSLSPAPPSFLASPLPLPGCSVSCWRCKHSGELREA